MKPNIAVAAVLIFASCASQRSSQLPELNREREVCKSAFPMEKGTALARANCINAATEKFITAFGSNTDIARFMEGNNEKLAEMIDSGALSPTDAKLIQGRLIIELHNNELQRLSAQQQAAALDQAGRVAWAGVAMGALHEMNQPRYYGPSPVPQPAYIPGAPSTWPPGTTGGGPPGTESWPGAQP